MLNKKLLLGLFLFSLSSIAAQTVLEVIPLLNRPAAELQPLIAPLLEPTDTLVGNDFSLIVKTTPARLAEIKALIKKLDTAQSNLNIRVIQSKEKTAEQLNAGFNIDVAIPVNHPANTSSSVSGRYEQNQLHSSRHSEQMLRTMEGKPAFIKVGGNFPVNRTTVYDSGYGQRTISNTTQLVEASTGFAVSARLNGEQVTLDVSPWSEQMQNSGTIETQSAQTTIKTRLGQWVEIGTINEESQASNSGLLSSGQASGQNIVHILVQVEKAH